MTKQTALRVGVDIGGTFTDIVTIQDGTLSVTKTSSTPLAPEKGVITGLKKARERDGFSFDTISFFGHGTTVATNAILEEEWAETALVTTAGFRDALEIGRQARPDIYDFQAEKPVPIVERDRRFEVLERLDERGNVLIPLNEHSVHSVAEQLQTARIDSVAICLLFAFENDAHEQQVCDRLRDAGVEASWSLSSEVLPEIREYERTLITAMNAALKPVMDQYIGNLETETTAIGIETDLKIMQSNGGIIDASAARNQPVNTLLSGPAAGVQGATTIADRCGFSDVITMDMGGTSCDVSLVEGGDPLITTDVTVGEYPVSIPMIDIHTIGAGGGSIAWLDAGGALRVGPQSASADPGPICYGRGGTRATVTDAQLLLGRLHPDNFLSGELPVETDEVAHIVERDLAEPMGQSIEEVAQGILDVANATMQRALRVVSVERGHDPREFALVAFGGAGPLHACKLARELDIPRVIIPRTAGVLSALGLLTSDVLYDYSTSRVRRLTTVDPTALQETFEEFEAAGFDRLTQEALAEDQMRFERALDLRYLGQSFELSVPVPDGSLDDESLASVAEQFHEQHRQRYGHAYPEEPIELVTLRLRARGLVDSLDLAGGSVDSTLDDARRDTRKVIYGGKPHETSVYDQSLLPFECTFEGPAIVEGVESTAVIPPDHHVSVDTDGNLLVEVPDV
ncbi:hydantoinase/oxoprolinase family protein [Halegenticoccus tardaugens]|uniref:hydantoinase/oxoprolinase family protein n=1 Tax=Halegenticoccus tardaugens TaxID=2071624 RepID=UPI00100B2709|nr:hydantoinase/oxoprolinase family protein [Halegenticoccus tardaugens]